MSTYFVVAPTKENIEQFCLLLIACLLTSTDCRRLMKLFLMISQSFGLGQTNWADKFGGIWGILAKLLALFLHRVPCPWQNGFGCFSNKKLWFSGLTHIYPKYIPNMILAVKNLRNSHHTSVVGAYFLARSFILHQAFHPSSPIHRLHSIATLLLNSRVLL